MFNKFFDDLLEKINGVDLGDEATMKKAAIAFEPADDGDTVLGEPCDFTKKLLVLWHLLDAEMSTKVNAAEDGQDIDVEAEEKMAKLLKYLFWSSLRVEIPGYQEAFEKGNRHITIRQGWQVVSVPNKECDCPTCSLRRAIAGSFPGVEVHLFGC